MKPTSKPERGFFVGVSNAEDKTGDVQSPDGHRLFMVQTDIARTGVILAMWSGGDFYAPPKVGERVLVKMNQFGPGTVRGWFVESGYLGLLVKVDRRPEWHVQQHPDGEDHDIVCVFGADVRRIKSPFPDHMHKLAGRTIGGES